MPYAANDLVSRAFIEGGIEITEEEYAKALEGILSGYVVRIDQGFELRETPKPTKYWLDAEDERETQRGEEPPEGSTTEPPPSPHHDLIDGRWVENLDKLEAYCLVWIDRSASEARARFISQGIGQEAVYLNKYDEALAYIRAVDSGGDPVDSDYPYLNAEATRRSMEMSALAGEVITRRNEWTDPPGCQIEAERVGGKQDVRAATTASGKREAADAAIAVLESIKP